MQFWAALANGCWENLSKTAEPIVRLPGMGTKGAFTGSHIGHLIRDRVLRNAQPHVSRMPALQDHTDLIASGWLDSMGFVELLVYLQSVLGKEIDLSELDPLDCSSIRGLVRGIVRVS